MRHNQFIKIALSIILGLVCIAAHADDKTVIRIKYVNPTTRSIVEDVPEATLQRDVLTVYTSALPANGMEYDFDLSGIGEGLFRLVLSGPSGEYEGYFTIH